MYKYLVVYFFTDDKNNQGIGNCELKRKKRIRSIDDIRKIEEYISKKNKTSNTFVLNYIYIGDD